MFFYNQSFWLAISPYGDIETLIIKCSKRLQEIQKTRALSAIELSQHCRKKGEQMRTRP
jgi:hypothetical protein